MKFIADLHLHSKFSRATSRDMTFDTMAWWAKVKGISLLATADFTHPEWFFLTKQKLEPAGNGLFHLKNPQKPENEYLRAVAFSPGDVSFILSTEISFIYSKKGKVRKVHLLLLAPDFESVEKINSRLAQLGGNLRSDGRPILGMDAKAFVKMVADLCPRCVVIPAHIWTPWFSLFGANSGFDAIEECFEEMTPFIFALETGLSSDPPMNWRLSALDRYALVSNSDAHSPPRSAGKPTPSMPSAATKAWSKPSAAKTPRNSSTPSNSSRKRANTIMTAIANAAFSSPLGNRSPAVTSVRNAEKGSPSASCTASKSWRTGKRSGTAVSESPTKT
jgi:PHP family Zn ribbon phosphoesterase